MKKNKYAGWIAVFLSLATLIVVLMTVHDMQTAQGIGLYLSLFVSGGSRMVFDIMVDGLAITVLVLLLVVPCALLGRFQAECFFRLLTAYLALLPEVDLSNLVHIFDQLETFALRQSVVEGDMITTFLSGMKEIEPVLRLGIPILCLLLMGSHATGKVGKDYLKKWHKVILWCELPLCLGVFLFPAIASYLSFFMQYFLLIVCFDHWEQWFQERLIVQRWGMVLFGGFWFRGIYLMIQVMSVWEM